MNVRLNDDHRLLTHTTRYGVFLVSMVTCILALSAGQSTAHAEDLRGSIRINGSSTVAPIITAAAEMFMEQHPRVRVTVGISGTGGGFKKFLDDDKSLRTDISDASRPIKKVERDRANKVGVSFIELPIAIDGIAVMVHPSNTFCDSLTVEELKRIWAPGSNITSWHQVRAGFPDLRLSLYGPGPDSGTFDYFTKVIVGKEKSCRSDFTASESDNVLVRGIAGDKGSLGYFGYSYYHANKDKLRIIGIDNNNGHPVVPNLDVIRSGVYKPLSRPLFLYVNTESYDHPQVSAFVHYFFDHAKIIVEHPRVNYVALSDAVYRVARNRFDTRKLGSAMAQAGDGPLDLEKIFTQY